MEQIGGPLERYIRGFPFGDKGKGDGGVAQKTRTAAMIKKTVRLREYLLSHPGCTQQEVMTEMRIKEKQSLYRLLLGLAEDSEICRDETFNVMGESSLLTIKVIEDQLEQGGETSGTPPMAERLLYLYNDLESGSLHGGITFDSLFKHYKSLWQNYGGQLPKDNSIKRTLRRDLDRLEDYHIYIERPDENIKKYRLKEKFLPKLSLENAAVLYVSTLLHRDTLLSESIEVVKDKIESGFFKGMPERSKLLQERIYILGDTLANPEQFGNILGSLIRAVSESFRVSVDYLNNEGLVSKRILEPLALVSKRGVWYLIARQADIQEIRTFRIDQIQYLVNRETENFIFPSHFSITDHIGASWGVFCNDDVEFVKVRFSPAVARRVTNLCYHPSQKVIEEGADGSVVLQFEVCGLVEMQSWLMQWGTQAEVLEPAHLREKIRLSALEMANRYL